MKVKLSQSAIYYLSDGLAESIKEDTKYFNASAIALNDSQEKITRLIEKLTIAKEINIAFLEANKENENK